MPGNKDRVTNKIVLFKNNGFLEEFLNQRPILAFFKECRMPIGA